MTITQMEDSKAVLGRCALCLASQVKLQRSHLMPKWAYRVARGSGSDIKQLRNGTAYYSDRQVWEHLLCDCCEQLLSVHERYVRGIVFEEDGHCPTFEVLGLSNTDLDQRSIQAEASQLNTSSIAKFASSIVWRAAVSSSGWGPVRLGRYQEILRQYLLDEIEFPQNCALVICVHNPRGGDEYYRIFSSPTSGRQDQAHFHEFACAGFVFRLYIGQLIPDAVRNFCLVRGKPPRLIISPIQQNAIFASIHRLVSSSNVRDRFGRQRKRR